MVNIDNSDKGYKNLFRILVIDNSQKPMLIKGIIYRNGFIRIAELLIAITILTVIFMLFYKQGVPKQETQDLSELARDILGDISARENLRSEIIDKQTNVNGPSGMVNALAFINASLPDYILFELRACEISGACGQSNYVGNVYSAERIISADKDEFNPIKLRLFLWVEEN